MITQTSHDEQVGYIHYYRYLKKEQVNTLLQIFKKIIGKYIIIAVISIKYHIKYDVKLSTIFIIINSDLIEHRDGIPILKKMFTSTP